MSQNMEILVSVIMEEAFQEAQAIIEKGRKETISIQENSLREQEDLNRQYEENQDQGELVFAKAKRISQVELQVRTDIIYQKELILENLLQTLSWEFYALPHHAKYPSFLKKLFLHALEHLEGDEFICQLNERDHSLISESLFAEIGCRTGKRITLDKEGLSVEGGVIIKRNDERVLYDNTLEAIFQRCQEHLRSIAAERLFSEG